MKEAIEDYTARARLFGGNRMKLGVMAFNCSHGSTVTGMRPSPRHREIRLRYSLA